MSDNAFVDANIWLYAFFFVLAKSRCMREPKH